LYMNGLSAWRRRREEEDGEDDGDTSPQDCITSISSSLEEREGERADVRKRMKMRNCLRIKGFTLADVRKPSRKTMKLLILISQLITGDSSKWRTYGVPSPDVTSSSNASADAPSPSQRQTSYRTSMLCSSGLRSVSANDGLGLSSLKLRHKTTTGNDNVNTYS
ncbi:hypothetical protein M8C21_027543, partial [Ambrosia artemisiifolia]